MNIDLKDRIILTFVNSTTPRIDGSKKPLNLTLGNTYELVRYEDGMVTVVNDEGKQARYIPSRFTFAVYIDNSTLEYRNASAYTTTVNKSSGIGTGIPIH